MEAALALAPEPASAAAARSLVATTLPSWGCEHLVQNARLVVTELVSNAIRHAGTEIEVLVELRPRAVRVAVADGAGDDTVVRTAVSEPSPPAELAVGGRGLRIVGEFADRWGVERRSGGGKVVWAEWRLPR